MSTLSEGRQPGHDDRDDEHNERRPRRAPSPAPDIDTPSRPVGGALTGLDDVRAPLAEPASPPLRLRRRELLAWGGAAALLPAFSSAARAQDELASSAAVPRPMSIGFVEGSERWRRLRTVTGGALNRGIRTAAERPREPARVVPAESLISGQQEAANELVLVRVHGLYPIPNPTHVRNTYLTVFFPSPEHGRTVMLPFTPWGYHSRPAPDPAPPTRFLAPLGADGALDFLLEVTPAPHSPLTRRPSLVVPSPGPVGGRFTASFTVDWFAGRPKLQRGVYLLGLAPDTWSTGRTLPMPKAGQGRPVELVSLMVSFEPVVER